jgi:hypothetical protein
MLERPTARRAFLQTLGLAGITCAGTTLLAQEGLKEPVFRVGNLPNVAVQKDHPLDPALKIARDGLEHIRRDVADYECTLVKRERVGNTLNDYEYMFARVRNRKTENGQVVTPLSVYLRFLKPDSVKGQEVLWVEGQNNGKLLGHQGGRLGKLTPAVWLDPHGPFAMKGNRYPITEMGVENLVTKLIEKGERDRKRDECEVQFYKEAKINGRSCMLLEVKHPVPRDYFDFHIAQIYIDNELNVPVRYAAYSWPEGAGEKPILLEEYTYLNMKVNVGLTDAHFDEYNKEYGFH